MLEPSDEERAGSSCLDESNKLFVPRLKELIALLSTVLTQGLTGSALVDGLGLFVEVNQRKTLSNRR